VQSVLSEVVGALGYDPDSAFKPFVGQRDLGLFTV